MPLQQQSLPGWKRGIRERSSSLQETDIVSWAQIQLFGPLSARWRVVATLSPRASLALLSRPIRNQQRKF
ncbi:hypothetical protein VZT92_013384 [Zoarces viviparus]|uniref:Uncharacterized protein n=1 Tax=Zoarces viviparus TaxID=48416 RepID=A0AAW1F4K4_ZOAVI